MSILQIATAAWFIFFQDVVLCQTPDLNGDWEMAVPRRRGAPQLTALILKQEGQQIKATLRFSGHEAKLKGTISGSRLQLRGRKLGVPYTIEAENKDGALAGVIKVLSVVQPWTGRRATPPQLQKMR
jgi:hypothetical protein